MELRIHLAGAVRVQVDGMVVDDTGLGSLGRLTLAFLVSERHRPVPTDELAEALWGEELPPTWRTALRAARTGVVRQAEGARAAADVALEAASRPFLVGARGDWVERRQAELVEVRLRALEASSEACTLAGDRTRGVARAEEAVALDPWRESAHVRLMAALAAAGNRGAALRAYERCRRLLADELGVRPSLQTERAYVDLLGAEPADALSTDANSVRPSLPLPLTSFVGREGERNEVRRLLGGTRLVTLTGPGGVGKSRLALEVAWELAGEDADEPAADAAGDVALVELAPLADPQGVPEWVAHVLGPTQPGGGDVMRALVSHLARRRLLLVLDNCEHLVDACAELAQHLLSSCPEVRILATSQSRLRVPGEATITLTPLPVPRSGTVTAGEAAASEAVRLFLARAAEARVGAVLTEANASAAAQICRRLDGLPLALELAASQVPKLSMEEIAAGLDDRFRLLADGPGTAPTRHQALRATLDWAHDRLSGAEARLLARLSVFSGGFTLAAAEAVAPEADDDNDVFPLLSTLVDASLVQADPRMRTTRYGLLESVRAYAGERLERSGEAAELRRHHLAWAMSLAEEVAPELEGPAQRVGLDRLQAEHGNLAAALAWATSDMDGAPGTALRLAALLGRYWEVRGHLAEGRVWLEWALSEPSPPEGRPTRARALGVRRELGDRAGLADSLAALASIALHQGDLEAAGAGHKESLVLRLGDRSGELESLRHLGDVTRVGGLAQEARRRYQASLDIAEDLDDSCCVTRACLGLVKVARAEGRRGEVQALLERSMPEGGAPIPDVVLAEWLEQVAGHLLDEHDLDDVALDGEAASVARLLAAAEALRVAADAPVPAGERAGHEADVVRVPRALGDQTGDAGVLDAPVTAPADVLSEARRHLRRGSVP